MQKVSAKQTAVANLKRQLSELSLTPDEINPFLERSGSALLTQKQKALQLLLRPGIQLESLVQAAPSLVQAIGNQSSEVLEQVEIQIKYDIYIEKERELVERMSQLENLEIPDSFDYNRIASLSNEALQKFKKIKPRTLGQASRISGVNPSDIQILMVYMGR
jgi:tRNA uridine 5-carboxymethylaminomethyl modification enzyme